jgi:hypothetical protein
MAARAKKFSEMAIVLEGLAGSVADAGQPPVSGNLVI